MLAEVAEEEVDSPPRTWHCVVVTATHKPFDQPAGDHFLPLHVGAMGRESIGYVRDDSGENISEKNSMYCELTGLYWAWKNIDADYIGLAHYRRQLSAKPRWFRSLARRRELVITADELALLVRPGVVLVPQKRRYWVSTIRSQYVNTMVGAAEHLAAAREAILRLAPEYLPAFDSQMRRRSAHLFNMFVMPTDLLDAYCSWLFPVLREVEGAVDYTEYSSFDRRFIGRVAERLLDVWISHNSLPVKHIGRVDLWNVNHLGKALAYVRSALWGRKQEASA